MAVLSLALLAVALSAGAANPGASRKPLTAILLVATGARVRSIDWIMDKEA